MEVQVSTGSWLEKVINCNNGLETMVTTNDLESLRAGEPLSVTRTVTELVVLTSRSLVGSVKSPLVGSMLARGGAPGARLNESVCCGTSASVAELEIESVMP